MTLAPWPEEEIRSFASIGTGAKDTKDRVANGKYPFFVRSQNVERINTWSFDGEAVLTAGDGVGTGKVFHYINGKFDYHQRVYRISDFRSDVSGRYFFHQFRRNFLARIESLTAKSSVDSVRMETIAGMRVPLPKRAEQDCIAKAVDDADDLIATLERLIAKKQAIKQGMMQQLLTGRTRLPGFKGAWSPVRLGAVGDTYGGLTGKSKDDFGTGSAVYVTFMGVMEGARLFGSCLERVNVRPTERQNGVLRGDVLFNGSSETPEEVALAAVVDYDPSSRTFLNSFCFGYRLKDQNQIDPTYLAYFFRSAQGREIIAVLAQGATRYNIAKMKLMQVSPVLPPIEEQRAVVEVLSDVEAEIDVLNLRLEKARAIKTGMMQQLLTGRTRLPVEVSA